jgi:DNA-binding response OmpR family regulator
MGAARQALPGLIEAAERDRRAVERIETHEIGAINHRIEQARLEDRRLDLIAGEDPGRDLSRERAAGRKAAAEQKLLFDAKTAQLAELMAEAGTTSVVFETARAGPGSCARSTSFVLLIEDDADISEAIGYQMEKAGLSVRFARTGEEGLEAARRGVDLVLLDLNLPGMDGLEVCRMIRRQQATAHVPIIIVSARGDEVDRVLGLEMGADDYLVKPFSLKELAARARVALRRNGTAGGEPPQGFHDESWEIEFDAYVVRYRGREIRLTRKEFELFRYMVERAGRVLTRERLLERIWGWDSEIDARSIDAHIRRLRVKLGEARHHVETVVGLGYRFVK